MRPLEPSKNKALVTVAGSLQEKHARGAYGEAVPKTTTNHRYVKSIVDTKVAFGNTLAKPSNSNLTAAHSSKLLGALPLGKGSADSHLLTLLTLYDIVAYPVGQCIVDIVVEWIR